MLHVIRNSVKQYCDQVKPGGGRILECMTQPETKSLVMKEDPNCFRALLKIQQDISNDASLDLHLQQDCSKEIKTFCHDRSDDLVSCLLKAGTQNRVPEVSATIFFRFRLEIRFPNFLFRLMTLIFN